MKYQEPEQNIFLEYDTETRNKFSWTTKPYVIFSLTLNGYIIVPRNFYHDRASHPAKWFGMEAGTWSLEQAICHDWLYETGLYMNRDGFIEEIPRTDEGRQLADQVLFELISYFDNDLTATTWYLSVRSFGKKRWYGPDRPQKREWIMPRFGFVPDYYEKFVQGNQPSKSFS